MHSIAPSSGWERQCKPTPLPFPPLSLSRCAFHDLDDLADIVSWAPGEVVGRRSGGRGRKELSPPLPLSSARTKKAIGRFFLSRQRGRLASFVALLSLLSPRLCVPPPRHGTHGCHLSAREQAGEGERRRGESEAKREFLFSPFRCPCFPRRDRLARRAFFLPPSIDPLAFSRRLPPPPLPSQPPPPTHSHQTGKSPRSTAAPREPPRRTSLRPSWSAKSRPTG